MTITSKSVQLAPTRRSPFSPRAGVLRMALTELWERFSFYGLQSILPFYLVYAVADGGLEMNPAAAAGIVGAYGGAVYIAQVAGAWLGDRLISPARLVFYGGVIITAGHLVLAVNTELTGLAVGLILIVLGTGALKTSITAIVGFFTEGQSAASRDVGFSYFYMAINIGAVLGPLTSGFAQNQFGFHVGFGLAAVGMGLALLQYVFAMKRLPARASVVINPLPRRGLIPVGVVVLAVVALLSLALWAGLLRAENLSVITTVLAIGAAVVYFVLMIRSSHTSSEERLRVKGFIPMFVGSAIFFGILFQQFTSIAILVTERVDITVGSWTFPVGWITMFSQLAAVLVTPLVTRLWAGLAHVNIGPSLKFGLGLVQIGIAYLIMLMTLTVLDNALIPLVLMLVIMFIAGSSEVMVGPIGLALSTKIGPARFRSQFVALNFLTLALGSSLSGLFGQLFSVTSHHTYFCFLSALGIICGLAFIAGRKPLERALNSGL